MHHETVNADRQRVLGTEEFSLTNAFYRVLAPKIGLDREGHKKPTFAYSFSLTSLG
jgi:hypothetical protein